jgi:hypothetical protein
VSETRIAFFLLVLRFCVGNPPRRFFFFWGFVSVS